MNLGWWFAPKMQWLSSDFWQIQTLTMSLQSGDYKLNITVIKILVNNWRCYIYNKNNMEFRTKFWKLAVIVLYAKALWITGCYYPTYYNSTLIDN